MLGGIREHRRCLFETGDTCTTHSIPVNEHSNIVKKTTFVCICRWFSKLASFLHFFSVYLLTIISCHFSPWWSPSNSFLPRSVSIARGFHCWLMVSDSLRCSLLSGMMIIWYHHVWNYNLYGMWMMTMMSFTLIFGWLDHQSRLRRAATAPSPGSGWF